MKCATPAGRPGALPIWLLENSVPASGISWGDTRTAGLASGGGGRLTRQLRRGARKQSPGCLDTAAPVLRGWKCRGRIHPVDGGRQLAERAEAPDPGADDLKIIRSASGGGSLPWRGTDASCGGDPGRVCSYAYRCSGRAQGRVVRIRSVSSAALQYSPATKSRSGHPVQRAVAVPSGPQKVPGSCAPGR